jgi:hypothetical protein
MCFFKKSDDYCDQTEDRLNTKVVNCQSTGVSGKYVYFSGCPYKAH